jgi:hypothetical protein
MSLHTLFPDHGQLRRIVTDPGQPHRIRALAWAALKSARGQPLRQARLADLLRPCAPTTDSAVTDISLAERLAKRRMVMRLRMAAIAIAASTAETGGDAA